MALSRNTISLELQLAYPTLDPILAELVELGYLRITGFRDDQYIPTAAFQFKSHAMPDELETQARQAARLEAEDRRAAQRAEDRRLSFEARDARVIAERAAKKEERAALKLSRKAARAARKLLLRRKPTTTPKPVAAPQPKPAAQPQPTPARPQAPPPPPAPSADDPWAILRARAAARPPLLPSLGVVREPTDAKKMRQR